MVSEEVEVIAAAEAMAELWKVKFVNLVVFYAESDNDVGKDSLQIERDGEESVGLCY